MMMRRRTSFAARIVVLAIMSSSRSVLAVVEENETAAARDLKNTARWRTANNQLHLNDNPVVLHGFGSTCTEYLLRGIGEPCFAEYDWTNPAQLLSVLNQSEVGGIVRYLSQLPSSSNSSVRGAVRIPMTASSWLNVSTKASQANMDKYPNLGLQYRGLISALVQNYTSHGIVVILDLHWSDDDTEQQPMALLKRSDGGPTGNALAFWDSVASTFAPNKLVFYELYNEPHTDAATWMNGTDQYAGMVDMITTVRRHTSDGVLVIAGAAAYAYDAASLVQLDAFLRARSESNVMFNFHPYSECLYVPVRVHVRVCVAQSIVAGYRILNSLKPQMRGQGCSAIDSFTMMMVGDVVGWCFSADPSLGWLTLTIVLLWPCCPCDAVGPNQVRCVLPAIHAGPTADKLHSRRLEDVRPRFSLPPISPAPSSIIDCCFCCDA